MRWVGFRIFCKNGIQNKLINLYKLIGVTRGYVVKKEVE